MSLHQPSGYAEFIAALPGTTANAQWDSLVAKVGGKAFCLLGDATGQLVFKVGEIAFAGLTEIEGVGQAAYFAKGQWVNVAPGALDEDLLAGYICESHRLVASKLTRKRRAELGL